MSGAPTPPPPTKNGEGPWKSAKKQNGEGPWNVVPLLPIPPHVPHVLDEVQQRELALLEARHAARYAALLKESYDTLVAIVERGSPG